MGDSLPAINVDQLTNSVNNAVHGNLLPPYPLLPVPPPPPSSILPHSGFPDGTARLPPVSGLPPLPMFSPLPTFPMPAQVSACGSTVTSSSMAVSDPAAGSGSSCDSPSPPASTAASGSLSTVTMTTTTLGTQTSTTTTCTENTSSSSDVFSSSIPHSLPGCPPMFIMFSLRLPVPEPPAQGGSQESQPSSSQAVPGPRLPPFPPFPLLLPFLPPPQEGQQPRPLLPFPELPTSAVTTSISCSLPLPPPVSFPQVLPLPPLPLQLPASLPPLPVPLQSPASSHSQSDFPLPPLLLQPPVSVSGSFPLPAFLPPPANSMAPFPCLPRLSQSSDDEGQVTLPLPPFPPQSFTAFVQSGVPLTSLSTSSLSLPPLLPRPMAPVCEEHPASQPDTSHGALVPESHKYSAASESDRNRPPAALVSPSTFHSPSFPPPGFPPLPPLSSSSSAVPGFSLLPPFPVPRSAASTSDAGFPISLSFPLPPPFSLPINEGSTQPSPVLTSVAGQPLLPPFPGQVLPPLPFISESQSQPPPPSAAFLEQFSGDAPLQMDLDPATPESEHSLNKNSDHSLERPSSAESSSASNDSHALEVELATEDSAGATITCHKFAPVQTPAQNVEMVSDASMEKPAESSDCTEPLTRSNSIHIRDSHALSTLYSTQSDVCQNKNQINLSTNSEPIPTYSAVQSSADLVHHTQMPTVSSATATAEPESVHSMIQRADTYPSAYLSVGSTLSQTKPLMQRSEPCSNGYMSMVAAPFQDQTLIQTSSICSTNSLQMTSALSHDKTEMQRSDLCSGGYIPVVTVPSQDGISLQRTDACSSGYPLIGPSQDKTLMQQSDALSSNYHPVATAPSQDNSLTQAVDPCGSRYLGIIPTPQDKTLDKPAVHHQKTLLRDSSGEFPMASFYHIQENQSLNQSFSSLQPLQERQYSFMDGLPSCVVETQTIPHQQMHKQQVVEPSSFLLTSVSDSQQSSYSHADAAFSDIQQNSTLILADSNTENLTKHVQVSSANMADVCQFPGSLGSLATDFSFSGTSAPTISVDQPTQTLLPSVGYSPPGLSSQGLSPNLFSPVGPMDKGDPSVQVVSSVAGGNGGPGFGLSGVSASVLDMLLLKADLSSVDKGAAEMTAGLTHPAEPCSAATEPRNAAAAQHTAKLPAASSQPVAVSSSAGVHPTTSVTTQIPAPTSDRLSLPLFTGQFCVECNKMCTDACKHGSTQYQHIADSPVLTRARATLPTCLKFAPSSVIGHLNTTGVFTKTSLQSKTEFGPLQGKLVQPSDTAEAGSFCRWKVFYDGSVKTLDISDEYESNWMMFVKPARNAMERNVTAFQCGHDILFVTCTDLLPDVELLFWFAPDYYKMLSGVTRPAQFCPYCPTCFHVFFERGQLQRHCKQAHGDAGVKKWSCSLCSVHFRSSGRLNEHVMAQHMHLKPYSCSVCGKDFADSRNLNTHLTIHTGIKKFGCDVCGKHFMQKAHLQSHQATHTKIKSAQCKFCSKRFVRISDMRQHELKHTKAQMHSCPQCSKTFHRPELLRRHTMSVHNNERNYMCERCSKTFHTKYKLTRHGQSCKSLKIQPSSPPSLPQSSQSSASSSSLMTVNCSVISTVDTPANFPVQCGATTVSVSEITDIQASTSLEVISSTTLSATMVAGKSSDHLTYASSGVGGRVGENDVIVMPPSKGPGLTVASMPMLINSAV